MKSKTYLPLVLLVSVLLLAARAADVREGLVSYWPLDSLSADLTTPDVVAGNNMLAVNFLDNSAVVAGKRGKAFLFDGDVSTRYLYFTTPAGADTGLPISRWPSYMPFCSGSKAREPGKPTAGCFVKARAWLLIRSSTLARTTPPPTI